MHHKIKLECRAQWLRHELNRSLTSHSVTLSTTAPRHVLVDVPRGWILSKTEVNVAATLLIATDNACPEYRLDVLERYPGAYFCNVSLQSMVETLEALERNDAKRSQPISPLTPSERTTLRLIAKGYPYKRIAALRKISEGRVNNIAQAIYQKLEIHSRVQLAHYYYGNWHIQQDEG